MRICYLADINSVHTKKWCNFFKAKGYEIHVISLTDGTIEGVKVHSLNLDLKKIQSNGFIYKFKYLFQINKVKKLVKEINPDILHSHYASSYGLLGALTKFHPFIISVWGSDVYEFPKKGLISKYVLKYNLSKCDTILSTSKVMGEETKKYINRDIEITPFGVDIDFFKPMTNVVKDKDKIIIGTVKSLETKYGIEYLIKAFGELRKKYSNIKLEIGGEGSQRHNLENMAKDLNIFEDVQFLGRLTAREVVEALNRYDIAVFPSLVESFGVAAVEAQACGVPVIASNVGGLPEATNPGVSSLLIEREDVKGLCAALEKLIEDPKLRREMGNNGRRFVEENYNIEKNFEKVNQIYKKLLS
jgi:glycosyltransferase involved in cell wall biosynthesis